MIAAPPSSPPAPSLGTIQSFARVGRLARKELAEIFRDKRTIITLVLMPLLLYPLLSFAFRQFLTAFATSTEMEGPFRIGVGSEKEKSVVEHYLARGTAIDPARLARIVASAAPGGMD